MSYRQNLINAQIVDQINKMDEDVSKALEGLLRITRSQHERIRELESTVRAARDHCDSGCINPGSGDCPTCKAAACGLPQVATQKPEAALSGVIRTGGSSGVEVDAEGTWYYDTEAGIRMPYDDYVAVTSPLKLHILREL